MVNGWRVDNEWWRVPISRTYYTVITPTMKLEIYRDDIAADRYPQRVIDWRRTQGGTMIESMKGEAYALQAGGGWIYHNGIDFTLKAGESGTTNGAAVIEYTTMKGEEPGDHTHDTEDEMFYVLEGALTFTCGGRNEGGFVFLPRGIEHGYIIRSEGRVRLLVITVPPRPAGEGWGGFVGSFESTGEVIGGHSD